MRSKTKTIIIKISVIFLLPAVLLHAETNYLWKSYTGKWHVNNKQHYAVQKDLSSFPLKNYGLYPYNILRSLSYFHISHFTAETKFKLKYSAEGKKAEIGIMLIKNSNIFDLFYLEYQDEKIKLTAERCREKFKDKTRLKKYNYFLKKVAEKEIPFKKDNDFFILKLKKTDGIIQIFLNHNKLLQYKTENFTNYNIALFTKNCSGIFDYIILKNNSKIIFSDSFTKDRIKRKKMKISIKEEPLRKKYNPFSPALH